MPIVCDLPPRSSPRPSFTSLSFVQRASQSRRFSIAAPSSILISRPRRALRHLAGKVDDRRELFVIHRAAPAN